MPVERVTQVGQTKPLYGGLSPAPDQPGLFGLYTYGVAGERFFREIKDNGRLMGARCPKCNLVYLPPRLYCERCFSALEEWLEIPNRGTVHTFTVAHIDLDGNRLEKPAIIALVRFDGVYGGLVHRLGKIEPEKVCLGMPVKVVFKQQRAREGGILDIEHFEPV